MLTGLVKFPGGQTDVAKRHVRACSLDMLMDVVPAGDQPIEQWRPATHPATAEGDLLRIVGDTFLRLGTLDPRDLHDLEQKLASSAFILRPPIEDRDGVVRPEPPSLKDASASARARGRLNRLWPPHK